MAVRAMRDGSGGARLTTHELTDPSRTYWVLLVVLLNGLDMATTAVGLHHGLPESNPVMSSMLLAHGEAAMDALKVAMIAALIVAVQHLTRRYRRAWPVFLAMALPAALVVVNNLLLIL